MAMQSCGKPELQRSTWRLRRPLIGRARQGGEEQLCSSDIMHRRLCRWSATQLHSRPCDILQPLRATASQHCAPCSSVLSSSLNIRDPMQDAPEHACAAVLPLRG